MRTRVRKRTFPEFLKGHLISILFFVMVFALFLSGVASAEKSTESEGREVLERNIHRAVISCYSIEGRYPQNVEYLKDNYGLIYDEDKYTIGYSIFADNIMPDITVMEKVTVTENETTN